MNLVSIDPAYAKPHAISLFIDGELDYSYNSSDLKEIMTTISESDRVVIEDQYYGMNISTVIKLAHATGELLALCKLSATKWSLVPPRTWQAYFGLYGKKPTVKPSEWTKLKEHMLIEKCKEFGITTKDVDIAASVLIGLYIIRSGK
jgi:hypothetical protein